MRSRAAGGVRPRAANRPTDTRNPAGSRSARCSARRRLRGPGAFRPRKPRSPAAARASEAASRRRGEAPERARRPSASRAGRARPGPRPPPTPSAGAHPPAGVPRGSARETETDRRTTNGSGKSSRPSGPRKVATRSADASAGAARREQPARRARRERGTTASAVSSTGRSWRTASATRPRRIPRRHEADGVEKRRARESGREAHTRRRSPALLRAASGAGTDRATRRAAAEGAGTSP